MAIRDLIISEVLKTLDSFSKKYVTTEPFPNVVIDKFLNDKVAEFIVTNFIKMGDVLNTFKKQILFKWLLIDIEGKWPIFLLYLYISRNVFNAKKSAPIFLFAIIF